MYGRECLIARGLWHLYISGQDVLKYVDLIEAGLEVLMKTNRSSTDDSTLLDITTRIQVNQLETDFY
jgi:hypothetical protein